MAQCLLHAVQENHNPHSLCTVCCVTAKEHANCLWLSKDHHNFLYFLSTLYLHRLHAADLAKQQCLLQYHITLCEPLVCLLQLQNRANLLHNFPLFFQITLQISTWLCLMLKLDCRSTLEQKVCDVTTGILRSRCDAQSACSPGDWTSPHCCPHGRLPCFGSPGKATR